MSDEVRLTFHKGGEKKQNSVVIESDKQKLVFKAWEQGIIPHEMVHYAVESVFDELKGFISLIGEGRKQAEIEGRDAGLPAAYIECLVGAFQYELWGLVPKDNEMLKQNFKDFTVEGKNQFSAEEFFEFIPDVEKIETCRQMLQDLTDDWGVLPEGNQLNYTLSLREEVSNL